MHESEETASAPDHTDERAARLGRLAPALLALDLLGKDANITRVAVGVGVSQSTLSRMIRRWERDLGVGLITRAGREIRMTSAGRSLAEAAGQALLVLDEALDAAPRQERTSLRLGYLRSLSTTVVAELVSAFHRAQPTVPLIQREGPTGELLDQLAGRELDLAVVSPRPPARFGWARLGRQRLVLAVPVSHPLAGRSAIDLAEVASERFLGLDARFATRAQAEVLTAQAGFEPRIVLQTDDLRTLREYVAEGHGIAIVPLDGSSDARVRTLTIRSPAATREVGLAWLRSAPPTGAPAAFLEAAVAVGDRYPGWADLLEG